MSFEQQSSTTFEQQIVTLQDVERHRAQARLMQSRETARLARRLFGLPGRLLRRTGRPVGHVSSVDARSA